MRDDAHPETTSIEGKPAMDAIQARIEAWEFTPAGAAIRFEEKLAREHGWTLGRAREVVREYRRFLVLTQKAGHPVCPSRDVDEAWHLHLTQTRDYSAFCSTALGRFLHHEPSREGAQELARHRQMYADTLVAYQAYFNEPPPASIWPPAEKRFSVVRSAPLRRDGIALSPAFASGWVRGPIVILLIAMMAVVYRDLIPSWLGVFNTWSSLFAYVLLVAITLFLVGRVSRSGVSAGPDPVDVYESSFLAGGGSRALAAAVAGLIARGAFALAPQRSGKKASLSGASLNRLETPPLGGPLDPLEEAVLAATRPGAVDMKALAEAVRPQTERIAGRLLDAGMLMPPRTLAESHLAVAVVLMLVCSLGVARMLVGFEDRSPMGAVLLAKVLVLTALAIIALSGPTEGPTPQGNAALARVSDTMAPLKVLSAGVGPASQGSLAMTRPPVAFGAVSAITAAVGLFGSAAVMADPRYAGFNFVFEGDQRVVTGTSGSVGACEAGCGGGCGGCG